jgi:hypothetical protein
MSLGMTGMRRESEVERSKAEEQVLGYRFKNKYTCSSINISLALAWLLENLLRIYGAKRGGCSFQQFSYQ